MKKYYSLMCMCFLFFSLSTKADSRLLMTVSGETKFINLKTGFKFDLTCYTHPNHNESDSEILDKEMSCRRQQYCEKSSRILAKYHTFLSDVSQKRDSLKIEFSERRKIVDRVLRTAYLDATGDMWATSQSYGYNGEGFDLRSMTLSLSKRYEWSGWKKLSDSGMFTPKDLSLDQIEDHLDIMKVELSNLTVKADQIKEHLLIEWNNKNMFNKGLHIFYRIKTPHIIEMAALKAKHDMYFYVANDLAMLFSQHTKDISPCDASQKK
jgi:hypothetical protein